MAFPGDLEVRVFAQTGEWGISLWKIGHKKQEVRVTGLGTTLGEGRKVYWMENQTVMALFEP